MKKKQNIEMKRMKNEQKEKENISWYLLDSCLILHDNTISVVVKLTNHRIPLQCVCIVKFKCSTNCVFLSVCACVCAQYIFDSLKRTYFIYSFYLLRFTRKHTRTLFILVRLYFCLFSTYCNNSVNKSWKQSLVIIKFAEGLNGKWNDTIKG